MAAASLVTPPSSSEAKPSDGNLSGSKPSSSEDPCAPGPALEVKHIAAGGFAKVDPAFSGQLEVDIVLGHQQRPGCVVGLRLVLFDPDELERRPRDRRRVCSDGQQRLRIVLQRESIHQFASPFVAPQRHFFEHQFSRPINQDRRMHLATGGDASNPISAMRYLLNDTPDTEDNPLPPGARTLLRPTEAGNDLIILFGRESKDLPGFGNESCSSASGSDVDRKQEVLHHGQGRSSLGGFFTMGEPNTAYLRLCRAKIESQSQETGRKRVGVSAVRRIGVIEGYPSMVGEHAPACPAWHVGGTCALLCTF